jgi:hypothetical protein
LRRSFVTHVNESGFAQPHVVEAIVNHVSGHLAGVAGTYITKPFTLPKDAERSNFGVPKSQRLWRDAVARLSR